MTVMTSVIPRGRPFTVDDLEGFPDDGNRYELIDGTLLVTPGPSWAHQEMGATLYVKLRAECPDDLRAMIAPFAVRTAFDSEVQPDVLVARYADFTDKNLPVAPVLVAEVLSRSTSLVDRSLKKAHYERIGVPHYWILDPAGDGALTAFANEGGGYAQVARVEGDQPFEAREPFPITVVPARLLDGLKPR